MGESYIYVYRDYCGDDGIPEYLRVKECGGNLIWRWCNNPCDATPFIDLKEAKQYVDKYIKVFGSLQCGFAFMETVTVMKNFFTYEIVDEVF